MFGLFKSKKKNLTEMLAILDEHGIRLSSERFIGVLKSEWGEALNNFEALLAAMGDEMLDEETFETKGHHSNGVWHFDTEAIEDAGSYVRIAENIARLAAPALDTLGFSDSVDLEEGKAWIEVRDADKVRRHDLRVDDDWVDPAIFTVLGDYLKQAGSEKIIAMHGLGQDCLIVCKTPGEIRALNKATGLKFR